MVGKYKAPLVDPHGRPWALRLRYDLWTVWACHRAIPRCLCRPVLGRYGRPLFDPVALHDRPAHAERWIAKAQEWKATSV